MRKYPDLTTLRILHYPDPRLHRAAPGVPEINRFLDEMTHRMGDLMQEARGVGLAATQVGWPFRFVVLNTSSDRDTPRLEGFIAPVILERSGKSIQEEGCLSVPGVWAKVKRAERVRVRTQLLSGETVEFEAEGLLARAWQHEVDHLEGNLFVDRIGPTARIVIKPQMEALEREFAPEADSSSDRAGRSESSS